MFYEDKEKVPVKDEAIGYEPKFFLDPNISIENGYGIKIPG